MAAKEDKKSEEAPKQDSQKTLKDEPSKKPQSPEKAETPAQAEKDDDDEQDEFEVTQAELDKREEMRRHLDEKRKQDMEAIKKK